MIKIVRSGEDKYLLRGKRFRLACLKYLDRDRSCWEIPKRNDLTGNGRPYMILTCTDVRENELDDFLVDVKWQTFKTNPDIGGTLVYYDKIYPLPSRTRYVVWDTGNLLETIDKMRQFNFIWSVNSNSFVVK